MADDLNRADEVGRIEQELDNLVRRYRALEDAVWWLKLACGGFVVALIAMAVVAAVIENPGMFVIAIGALGVSAIVALVGPIDWSGRSVRLIDLVGWQPIGLFGGNIKRSEAMATEDMIAERVRRLAQLRAQS